ncbi:DUF4054 domain-containing protein [Xylella taiwanensis]|uniref:DUF4054 domain-containing protein n=1 Tax=Xylella taiwanensis TaxID=1444770 RepID=Z9JI62_9GAMM|nr:DUF4054 domain-containing protein [Xylella taiwanensis]AXI83446.1 hypothetical protein AB672_05605 [Xylella taiwanensis]EWS77501.1 hypothetical protein AF72_10685 [Xylella taiwanensis]MCD8456516.1 DUF4054 domain-containing protein [Xylella taiwanensis]MCD8458923.1 DUF4054 domain-containing protein [Xylella taiwanensis]MCD8461061.1 DUF4054 domain-containing protein [Xylella taiwanensis]
MAESLSVRAFINRYPEFATQPQERLALAIEDAGPWVDARRWGPCYQQGLASLAAHFVWSMPDMSGDAAAAGAKGAVIAERAGDLQVGYAAAPSGGIGDAWLMTSVYGQRYVALRRRAGMGAV